MSIQKLRYWSLLLLVISLVCPRGAHAAQREFSVRYTTNDAGDIAFVGNTLMTLTGETQAVTTAVQNATGNYAAGTNSNNNQYFMGYVQQDTSVTYENSSTAMLALPPGATVLWAGLYWGANMKVTGSNSKTGVRPSINSSTASKGAIRFKTPASASYYSITASVVDEEDIGGSSSNDLNYGQPYSSFANITALVQSAGNGVYSAGQVLAAAGYNRYAVWTMVVVYRAPGLTPKNLTVFDGFKVVRSGSNTNRVDVPISGFLAPPYGTVNAKVGVMSYEGDRGYNGDALLMGPTTSALLAVDDSLNKDTNSPNFANSTITYMGHYAGPGDPGYPLSPRFVNQLGVDADILTAPAGAILNSGTNAVIRFSTDQDAYYPAVLTTAIELYAPQVRAQKDVVDINGDNVTPGDILTYTIDFTNRDDVDGDDTRNTVLTDVLPPQVKYIPGSLRVVRVGETTETPLTDAGDSDDGEVLVDGQTETIVVRLGHPYDHPDHEGTGSPGGVGTAGGVVKRGETTRIIFDVRVKPTVEHGVPITNEASIGYESLVTGVALVASVAPVTVNNSKIISGVVFEDIHYGGGAGRGPLQAPTLGAPDSLPVPLGARRIPNARVELYGPRAGDPVGSPKRLIEVTTTDSDGVYRFPDIIPVYGHPTEYFVRVVSDGLNSPRGGATGLIPVLTYRTETEIETGPDGDKTVVKPVLNRVGGENPGVADAPPGTNIGFTEFPSNAQNIAKIHVTDSDVLRVDFGFSYNTVVNTNDSGQGSLRQAVINANALPNTGLAQAGHPSGIENIVFMIANGTSAPGLQSGYNLLTTHGSATAARISLASPLPAITDPLVINGGGQPGYGSDPVIWLDGAGAGGSADGIAINSGGQGSSVIALSITNFGGHGVSLATAGNNQIKGNFIGIDPAKEAAGNRGSGVHISGSAGNTIGGVNSGEGNIIAHNGAGGAGAGVTVQSGNSNAIRRNSIYENTGLGIDIATRGVTPNDGAKSGSANQGMDYPILTSVTPSGSNIVVTGYIGSNPAGNTLFGNAAIELFVVNDDGDQDGAIIAGDGNNVPHGEGEVYLATVTAQSNGTFTATIPAPTTGGARLTATATDASGNTSEFSPNIPAGATAAIRGIVFEDQSYSGGEGRPFGTAGTVAVANASVELYSAAGAFISKTTTDTSGAYSFTERPDGTYTVRVVTASVASARPGSVAGLLPVQTYRTDWSTGALVEVKDHIGGEAPALDDTAPEVLATTGSVVTQSASIVEVAGDDIEGVDFGFNFNTITNTRDAGRGSLRQFILNANALQGHDEAVFMISNGTAGNSTGASVGGLRPALNFFVGGVAPISLTTSLPNITERVTIDGSKQPGFVTTPVIEVNGTGGAVNGFTVSAGSGSYLATLAINRFSGTAIVLSGGTVGNLIRSNKIGTNAAGTLALPNGIGISIQGAMATTIGGSVSGEGNLIAGNTSHGIAISGADSSSSYVEGNVIGISGTQPLGNGGSGIFVEGGAKWTKIGGDAAGTSNQIAHNGAGGVVLTGAGAGHEIRRNSISGNIGLGIDLGNDGVTPNSGQLNAGPNAGMNYPVFNVALDGGQLRVKGFVGSAPGQAAFAGAMVDLYRAHNSPSDQNGPVIAGDGQAVPHGEGSVYIGTFTVGGNGEFDVTIPASGISLGDEITATATDASTKSTSEFSANMRVGVIVSGFVYNDADRDASRGDGETGIGLPLIAKLVGDGGQTAAAVTIADPASGAYEFVGVQPGTWGVVIHTDAAPGTLTPLYPAGWKGTEQPDGRRHPIAVSQHSLGNLNFGLSAHAEVKGHVFIDTGSGTGGIANDGTRNGTEKGLGDVVVKLSNADGSLIYGTATTAQDGSFSIILDNTIADGTPLRLVKINPSSYLSTGAVVGNTVGTYLRDQDALTFTFDSNIDYSGIELGVAPLPGFETDGELAGAPGTIVFFSHTFTAGSAGVVTFSTLAESSPSLSGWVETLYLDSNGNGQFDSGEPVITGPLAVTAGEVVKILVKEFIPVNAPHDARNKVTVSAQFVYTGAPAPLLTVNLNRSDLTLVGTASGSGLVLQKEVDKSTALPGEELVYTLTYSNKSAEPLTNIVVHDSTPEFTTFVSTSWATPLPGQITAITVTAPEEGETGPITWTLDGSLLPGGEGTITFTVKVAP